MRTKYLPVDVKLEINRIKITQLWKNSSVKAGNLAHETKHLGKRRIHLNT